MVPPLAPGCPLPAVTVTRVNVKTDPFAKIATLDAGVVLGVLDAPSAVNAKSWNVTPVVVPVTSNAYPCVVGATVVGVLSLYTQLEHENPP